MSICALYGKDLLAVLYDLLTAFMVLAFVALAFVKMYDSEDEARAIVDSVVSIPFASEEHTA
eukprot:3252228-Rhodomonas_salina.1